MNELQELINNNQFRDAYNLIKSLKKNDPMLTPTIGPDPFLDSCCKSKLNLISAFIEKGVDINRIDGFRGELPLIAMIKRCSSEESRKTILFLLEKGADPNRCNVNKQSPLIQSIMQDNNIVTEALIKKGADLNYINHTGNFALKMACMRTSRKTVATLIENKADLNTQDKEGKTALFHSKMYHDIELLISSGADLRIKDNQGKTALEYEEEGTFKYNAIRLELKKVQMEEEWQQEKKLVTTAGKVVKTKTKKHKKLSFRNKKQ